MTRSLIDDWRKTRRRLRSQGRANYKTQKIALVSGTLIAPILQGMARDLAALTSIDVSVVPAESRSWGPRVTVSGLLTAEDIVAALRQVRSADLTALPRASLDYAGQRFLDDGTPTEVAAAAETPILFAHSLSELLRYLSSPLK